MSRTSPETETITFPRWWVEQSHAQLTQMVPFPSGRLGDWAFLFREMLSDALAKPGVAPTPNELLMWAAAVAEKGAKQCSDGDSEWHRGFRYAADNTAKGIAADLRRAALAVSPTAAPAPTPAAWHGITTERIDPPDSEMRWIAYYHNRNADQCGAGEDEKQAIQDLIDNYDRPSNASLSHSSTDRTSK